MLEGAVHDRLILSGPLAVAVRPVGAPGGAVSIMTLKTAESPYMGRWSALALVVALPMGPLPVSVELGRPTRGVVSPRAMPVASVPSSSQPVQG